MVLPVQICIYLYRLYLCMYLYLYVYLYLYLYTYLHICMYMHIHISTPTCINRQRERPEKPEKGCHVIITHPSVFISRSYLELLGESSLAARTSPRVATYRACWKSSPPDSVYGRMRSPEFPQSGSPYTATNKILRSI